MHQNSNFRVRKQRPHVVERSALNRVDQNHPLRSGQLHQTNFGNVGFFANELRVVRDFTGGSGFRTKASTSAKVVSTQPGAEGIEHVLEFRDTVFFLFHRTTGGSTATARPPCPRDCFKRLGDGFEGGLLMEGTKNTAQPAPDSSVGLMERSRAAPTKAKSSRSST